MSRKLFVIFLLSIFALNVSADKRKEPINIPVKVNYSLPRVALDVKVTLERKVFKKGPFAQYAERFLGVNSSDIINQDREEWKLMNVEIDSHTEADPNHNYSLSMVRDYSALRFKLSPQGFLTGFNTTIKTKEKLSDFSSIDVVAPSEVKELLYAGFSIDRPYNMLEDTTRKAKEGQIVTGANLFSFDFEGKTEMDKAKEAAHIIYKLRKRRFKILTSNFEVLPPDGVSYKVLVKELKKLEKKYLELFLGKECTEKYCKNYKVIPKVDSKSQVVMRYSLNKGFVSKTDVSGLPVILEYKDIVRIKSSGPVSTQTAPNKIIYYRLPAQVNVVVMSGKKKLGAKSMIIPQLGSIGHISATVVAEEDLSIDFHPQYGSIKNIYKRER
jgi:hypothetical protein